MSKILIISGHPDVEHSLANRTILNELADEPNITVEKRYLDKLYPDFHVDVATEQAALVEADIIVWQFPFHWYALPALLKKWIDDVLVFGFAHGTGGDKLHGKKLILSFTTGAPENAYAHGQPMNFTVEEFLPPLRQTAMLCGMDLQDAVYSTGMMFIPGVSSATDRTNVVTRALHHAERVAALYRSLCVKRQPT
ncbi:NAD(P)H-dependent oxidoreductase [Pseudomonas syringae]|uniref:NADPH oxidoreductase n=1 Tax=Pseudomonas syringae pv. daphniphylli TaxID=264455 RepID=A0A9X0KV71_PSESX|nr:NAD(P)H-dependent oxidoreductase [Pseudomonas syringae]KPX09276.1 putative NADPH oxidoreductase [Pseudomonas syringae pv. daphniphylli]KWS85722.1 hypothetical protein AL050_26805 [Pseudomonas syringae pv. daphniphylli]